MKKLIQGIIAFSLVLDVAVVFGFGLTLVSSYENGSLLPVYSSVVRSNGSKVVAGEETTTVIISVTNPTNGGAVNGVVTLRAQGATVFPFVSFDITQNSTGSTGFLTSTSPMNSLVWERELDTRPMPNGEYSLRARAVSSTGVNLAVSPVVTFVINNSTSSGSGSGATTTNPTLSIVNPTSGSSFTGGTVTVTGELRNFAVGWMISEAKLFILKDGTPAIVPAPVLTQVSGDPLHWRSEFQTGQLPNGVYDLKLRIAYIDSANTQKVVESTLERINISATNTSTTNTSTTNASATNSSATNTTTTTNTSGTSGSGSSSTNTSTSVSADPVIIRFPDPNIYTIFRKTSESRLVAQTSVTVNGLDFAIKKVSEATAQRKAATFNTQLNSWTYNLDLANFKDGEYDFVAIGKTSTGELASKTVRAAVQKLGFRWINPQANQKLSGTVPVTLDLGGIYEKDDKTPYAGMRVEIWQSGVQAPFNYVYKGRAVQKPGTHEWKYTWNTTDTANAKYRLVARVGMSTSTTYGSIFDEALFIEISNPLASAPTTNTNASASNTNTNAGSVNTNISPSTSSNTNTGTTVAVADADNDLLSDTEELALGTNPNAADTDGDGLTDYEEAAKYKTDPLKTDTDGDSYSDFTEVRTGNDPLKIPGDKTSTPPPAPKPVEEPKTAGTPTPEILIVTAVKNAGTTTLPLTNTAPTNAANANESTNASATNESETQEISNKIVFEGKGPANQILTLFIYSTDPLIVTVKTDENGDWSYELDKSLQDGEHELYVTVTDDTGKIQSKSNPISFFVKEAQAVSPEEFRADTNVIETPGSSLTNVYLMISGAIVLVAVLVGIIIAFRRKNDDAPTI